MTFSKIRRHWMALGLIACAVLLGLAGVSGALAQGPNPDTSGGAPLAALAFDAPTTSSPIAMDASKNLIWVVNPDDDSVSVIGNLNGTPSVLTRFTVGNEPQGVALALDCSPRSNWLRHVALTRRHASLETIDAICYTILHVTRETSHT